MMTLQCSFMFSAGQVFAFHRSKFFTLTRSIGGINAISWPEFFDRANAKRPI